MKMKEQKPITITVINPEALPRASEIVTEYYYKKYLKAKSEESKK